jgi:hypothetical protein
MMVMQTVFAVVFISLPFATCTGVLVLLARAAVRRLRGTSPNAEALARTASSHA